MRTHFQGHTVKREFYELNQISFCLDAITNRFLKYFNDSFQYLDKLMGQLRKM